MAVLTPITYATNKIKDTLSLDNHQLRELMSVSQSEFSAFENDFSKASLWAMHSLATRLGITMENLATGRIDFEALKEHFKGNFLYIPKRYQAYKESRFQTISNILDGIEPLYRTAILNKLQLNEMHFKSPTNKICGLALIDTQVELKRLGLSSASIKSFGYLSSQKYKSQLIPKGLADDVSPKKLYEDVIENINTVLEKNMNYDISAKSHDSILMTVTTRQELQDSLKIRHFGTPEHCSNVAGWASGVLKFRKHERADVKKLSCVHEGAQSCQYEINYAHTH